MGLWLPEKQIDAEREELVERTLGEHVAEGRALERELRKLDPYLRVVYIGERAPDLPGLFPGRWHVQRKNPDTIDSYFPIAGPNGEYLEPSFRVIDEMKRADLWKDGAMEKLSKRRAEDVERRRKAKELASEQRKDQAAESFRAAKRVAGENLHKRNWAKA